MADRKKFVEVEIPNIDSSIRVLGSPEELNKRTIKLDLTRKMRGKGLVVKFRIFNEKGKLFAIPNRIELVKAYIRRIMRKRIDYVEDSFKTSCADITVTIKPILITRKRVSRAVRRNLRNTAKEYLIEYTKERNYLHVCNEILDGTLQKSMLPKLKKVYPLSFCDIRIFETKELEKINLEEIFKVKENKKEEKTTSNEDLSEEIIEEDSEENVEEDSEKETEEDSKEEEE